jgi:hypothetical protein
MFFGLGDRNQYTPVNVPNRDKFLDPIPGFGIEIPVSITQEIPPKF